MSYDLVFDPNFENSAAYHQNLKLLHPEAASEDYTKFDREYMMVGEKVTMPPMTTPTSCKNLISMFNMVLSHHFVRLPVYVYPIEHFETLFEENFGAESVTPEDYIKVYYESFKANDHALLLKDAVVFPCHYGFAWHTVVVDKPINCVTKGQLCNVYLISTHNVVPEYAIAKVITKYMTMAFLAMSYNVISDNFVYHELVLEEYSNQDPVVCCLYTELVHRIVETKKNMTVLFDGIKKEVMTLKMDNYIFSRYLQTLMNCFAIEHNKYGQIADFDVLLIENEDLIWVEKTDIDRILNPARQMRNIRPIQQFSKKRSAFAFLDKLKAETELTS